VLVDLRCLKYVASRAEVQTFAELIVLFHSYDAPGVSRAFSF
jgi:hypothetical protein